MGDYQRILPQPIGLTQDKAIQITFQAFIDAFQSSENLGGGGVLFAIVAFQRPLLLLLTNCSKSD